MTTALRRCDHCKQSYMASHAPFCIGTLDRRRYNFGSKACRQAFVKNLDKENQLVLQPMLDICPAPEVWLCQREN